MLRHFALINFNKFHDYSCPDDRIGTVLTFQTNSTLHASIDPIYAYLFYTVWSTRSNKRSYVFIFRLIPCRNCCRRWQHKRGRCRWRNNCRNNSRVQFRFCFSGCPTCKSFQCTFLCAFSESSANLLAI